MPYEVGEEAGEPPLTNQNTHNSLLKSVDPVAKYKNSGIRLASAKAVIDLVKAEIKGEKESSRLLNTLLGRSSKFSRPEDAEVKSFLTSIVGKMKRHNVWRTFPSISKGILNLCIKLQIHFRSELLLKSLAKVLKDALLTLSPLGQYWLKGVERAHILCRAAYNWGNCEALKWRHDDDYIICLGINMSGGLGYR